MRSDGKNLINVCELSSDSDSNHSGRGSSSGLQMTFMNGVDEDEEIEEVDDDKFDSDSLIGSILVKRQRVNSESTYKKQKFSFVPTQNQPANTSTAPFRKPFSFSPTCGQPVRPRDMKASSKQFADRTIGSDGKIPSDENRRQLGSDMPSKVEIRVPDLRQNQQEQRPGKPQQSSPSMPSKLKPIFSSSSCGSSLSSKQQSCPSPAKSRPSQQQSTPKDVCSKPAGLRDRASQLARLFRGECLSEKKLSIVKGAEAFKFKCINGHIFYRFVTELEQLKSL